MGLIQPLGVAKKSRQEGSPNSISTVHVTGQASVAAHVKQNLEKKTCLKPPREEGEGAAPYWRSSNE